VISCDPSLIVGSAGEGASVPEPRLTATTAAPAQAWARNVRLPVFSLVVIIGQTSMRLVAIDSADHPLNSEQAKQTRS